MHVVSERAGPRSCSELWGVTGDCRGLIPRLSRLSVFCGNEAKCPSCIRFLQRRTSGEGGSPIMSVGVMFNLIAGSKYLTLPQVLRAADGTVSVCSPRPSPGLEVTRVSVTVSATRNRPALPRNWGWGERSRCAELATALPCLCRLRFHPESTAILFCFEIRILIVSRL